MLTLDKRIGSKKNREENPCFFGTKDIVSLLGLQSVNVF